VHVDINQKLRSKITEWQTDAGQSSPETENDLFNQPDNIWVNNVSLQYLDKYLMINAGKKLLDITFQHIASPRIVPGDFSGKIPETVKRPMAAFIVAARI